jgi:hypothetical protein
MRAHVGDQLLPGGGSSSVGLIVGVLGKDGLPPYVVKWLRTGHIAMVSPGQFARVIPAGEPGARHTPVDDG